MTRPPGAEDAGDEATAPVIGRRDRVPAWVRDAHLRLAAILPADRRRRTAVIIGLIAAALAAAITASRLLIQLVDSLDVVAYTGLFLTNWVANGGLLVPLPGLRLLGWLMIIQQGAALDPLVAGTVGGLAMALGQTSLFVVAASAREGAAHHPADHAAGLRSMASGERARRARARIERLLGEHGFATIVTVSLLPTPLTTMAVGAAGATDFGFRRFVLASLVGRLALGLLLAYLGESIMSVLSPDRR